MGWWSVSIMGGDTPLDFQGMFEDRFGSKGHPGFKVPTAEEGVQFIRDNWGRWGSDESITLKQVTGFLMIERAAPFNDELRKLVLEGLDEEIETGCEEWKKPEQRLSVLQGFRKLVEAYPNEGVAIELPHQPGLFEMFDELLSGKSNME